MFSPAVAQPEEDGARQPFRGQGERYRPRRSERDWVQIVSPTPTKFGTEYIIIGSDAGVFRTLRIDAITGVVIVRRIAVLTHDHVWKTYYVNRRLDRFSPSQYVDLDQATRISQLAITTDRRFVGKYTVHGSSGRRGPAPVLVSKR